MNKKQPYLIDLPVLLVFFTKEKPLKHVFERIRDVKPSKLYLCQDGPREGREGDIEKIKNCREIVSDIDWECEIHERFQEKNLGCDAHIYQALEWVFQNEEYMVMLEDDGLVDATFFPFCKYLFEKYYDDKRIALISSFNLLEKWDCPYDYFFSTTGTLSGGWGMWRRAWESRNEALDFLNDKYTDSIFHNTCFNHFHENNIRKSIVRQKETLKRTGKIHSFELIVETIRTLNHSLSIVPTLNMMSNIGIDSEAFHSGSNIRHLPKKLQKIFFMQAYNVSFPLKEPPFMIPDMRYCEEVYKIIGDSRLSAFVRSVESFIRRLFIR